MGHLSCKLLPFFSILAKCMKLHSSRCGQELGLLLPPAYCQGRWYVPGKGKPPAFLIPHSLVQNFPSAPVLQFRGQIHRNCSRKLGGSVSLSSPKSQGGGSPVVQQAEDSDLECPYPEWLIGWGFTPGHANQEEWRVTAIT